MLFSKINSEKPVKRNTFVSQETGETFVEKGKHVLIRKLTDSRTNRFYRSRERRNKAVALHTYVHRKKVALFGSFIALSLVVSAPFVYFSQPSSTDLAVAEKTIELPSQTFSSGTTLSAPAATRDNYNVKERPRLSFAGMRTAPTYVNDPHAAVQWPFGEGAPISDGFGPRTSPCTSSGQCGSSNHQGIDFNPGEGINIQAIANGVVKKVDDLGSSGLGYYVVIEHNIGGGIVESYYGHMQRGSSPLVEGQNVTVGDLVGLVGNTGMSTGAHLHLEIHVNGKAIDPMAWDKWNTY